MRGNDGGSAVAARQHLQPQVAAREQRRRALESARTRRKVRAPATEHAEQPFALASIGEALDEARDLVELAGCSSSLATRFEDRGLGPQLQPGARSRARQVLQPALRQVGAI